ncbi:crossover junction endonuclease MUS81 [Amyelois transitella]|uniref:crossover junction endonuclease MUS81 n=1 Tax=Amyelois transitella TaxID=680683 RepID=UPI00298FF80A|nr:crossover junction endonuclease MUS81 [Amyelois transitella]
MCSTSSKRITYKRTRPNPLFQEWLEELHDEAKVKKSKLEPMLKEALDSISKYPLPLQTGAECAILKGFEKKLCLFLDKRLEVYNHNKSFNSVSESENQTNNLNSKKNHTLREAVVTVENIDNIIVGLPKKSASTASKSSNNSDKTYRPSFRSGGYAILVALLGQFRDDPNQGLSKEQLIEKAQPYSEESFLRPKPDTFYTAWNSISRLITKGLVQKSRNNKTIKYMLTETGVTLAIDLETASVGLPTTNDIIFNSNADSTEIPNSQSSTINLDNANSSGSQIELKAGTFDIILLIDKNETSGVTKTDPTVAQFNKYPALKHEYRSLKVGDFTWVAQDKQNKDIELVIPYVIERKRMDDLGHSIRDGRFHEQKFRLRKCGLNNVIYLVENYGKNKHVGLPIQSLMQALANTRVQDGFNVHITNSLSETVRFLAMLSKRLTIEYTDKNLKGCDGEPYAETLMTFKYFSATSKKSKPLTVTETFIKLLLQLKGVSVDKALAITKVFSTPRLLIEKYKECDQREGEFLLANLKYGESNRSVGPVVSKTLYQLFTKSF